MYRRRRTQSSIRTGWLVGFFVVAGFGILVLAEQKKPLREATEPKLKRDGRNFAVAVLAAATVRILERPVVGPLAELVERHRWGFLKKLSLPYYIELPAAILLMDYTFYVWHILLHRVPVLWRFHQVHHVDLDLSASTALRFHFGELALSVPWRALQILTIGTSPKALRWSQNLLFLSVVFHHSNLRLPINWEQFLVRLVVTPRMHGIHHSIIPDEVNSNWSSGLSFWDWLHGTLKLNIPQQHITIGIPAYRSSDEVTLPRVLRMPFEKQRESFLLQDGLTPQRNPQMLLDGQSELAP